MTKKDFFRVIIKLFGLYLTVSTLFSTVPAYISYSVIGSDIVGFLSMLGSVSIAIALFVLLIFKADTVIDWLKLDQGFDDEFVQSDKFNSENVLKLGSVIIGGFLLIDYVPNFLNNALVAFQSDIDGINLGFENSFNWVIASINIAIGYLLVTNYGFVANLLKGKDEENNSTKA